ncbi:DNA-binding GntR family transcriptional regulator [Palleronia aestuarii]|uniref:DNA-binding GntR family transcriptional regulator n=1 Tax=Palleronia aestuarii TaxID=568105 RepID=A0A2W7NG93_9RHOB|nr:GntR family transcriptional regulator [Palleronia aestuarii]PZX17197.1 DNA-binding GntR family transcriptional regulator [Palleronia aestuarii]
MTEGRTAWRDGTGAGSPETAELPEVQLARALEAEVIAGRFAPGSRLREEDIAGRHGASRHHVRAALMALERTGLVERERNKGARIRTFTAKAVRQLYDVREMLTRQAALRVSLPIDAAKMADLRELQAGHDAAITTGDPVAIHFANDRFHHALFDLCGNPYLIELLRAAMNQTYLIRAATTADAARLETARREHHMMIDLLGGTDGWAFAELGVAHLRPSQEAYLARLTPGPEDRRRRRPAR